MIVSENDLITKSQCELQTQRCYKNNIKPIMDELKNVVTSINDFKLEVVKEIASMPEKIIEKTNSLYANKELEETVKSIKEKQEQRTNDWLSYSIITAIGTLLAVLGFILVSQYFNQNQQQNSSLTINDVQKLIDQNNAKQFEQYNK